MKFVIKNQPADIGICVLSTLWWGDTKQEVREFAQEALADLLKAGLVKAALALAYEVTEPRHLEEGQGGITADLTLDRRCQVKASWSGQWTTGRWLEVRFDVAGGACDIEWETGTDAQSRFITSTLEGVILQRGGWEGVCRANSDPEGVAAELGAELMEAEASV